MTKADQRRPAPIVQELIEAGWRLRTADRSQRHGRWLCPCGKHHMTIAKTPSDWRYARNARSQIRRCKREAEG